MTGHIYFNRLRALRTAAVVDALPLLEDGIQFLPIVSPLESECVGERRRTQGLLQLGLRYPISHIDRRSQGQTDVVTKVYTNRTTRRWHNAVGDHHVGPREHQRTQHRQVGGTRKTSIRRQRSNDILASSWPKAFILTPSPSASSVYHPVFLFTGGVCC